MVPSRNTPTRVSPSLTLSPKKNSLVLVFSSFSKSFIHCQNKQHFNIPHKIITNHVSTWFFLIIFYIFNIFFTFLTWHLTFFYKIYKALACSKGLGFFGGCIYSTPIFWSLPLHLEVLNLLFLMEIGDFTFFLILYFLNLEYTWTFISTIGIFVSWKIEITKNSSRIASVMRIFCTLLQCRVNLSMFHSSSTSKIWQTTT
jgi:hypothetical protein